mmetsp:Transcript_76029/g.226612  ORF Transcript_76029/g.226612 Transcript_76029/m.226612 type:complete len:221 (-) Transcript_76029:574-1236(-)
MHELLPDRGHCRPAVQRLQDIRDIFRRLFVPCLSAPDGLVGNPVLRCHDEKVELAKEVFELLHDLGAELVVELTGPARRNLELRVALVQQCLALGQLRVGLAGGRLHGAQVAREEGLVAVHEGLSERAQGGELQLRGTVPAQQPVDDGLHEDGKGDGADLLVACLEGPGGISAAGDQKRVHAEAGDEAADVAPHLGGVVDVGEEEDVEPGGGGLREEAGV